ncbi:hypothetical protein HPP92_019576 [Vanilla planifolia]|uniref:GATA-type domain-containing protein n=1 Tax=Vanilla planifolia TaxID=51239 RepID=A0A835UKW3_VANPL|nr:hypothetical protein HPP92_019576 [Vanilla planifolia]
MPMTSLHRIHTLHIASGGEAAAQIPNTPFLLPRTTSTSLPLLFEEKPINRARKPNRPDSLERLPISESSDHKESTWTSHACFGDENPRPKWMPSKMRIMRKMMGSNQPRSRRSIHRTQDAVLVRVCSDCNTTKTPLWRSGPLGPKRKARSAMAGKDKAAEVDRAMPFKKRCRFMGTGEDSERRSKACFEDIVRSLKGNTAFRRVFPEEEKDAAILLMALSCGIVCS